MKTLSENTEKIQRAYDFGSVSDFRDSIEETSSFKKLKAVENFKELSGTEKQIAWATEIRLNKASQFSFEKCCIVWDMNTQKRGEKGMGDKTFNFEKAINILNKKYAFISRYGVRHLEINKDVFDTIKSGSFDKYFS